MRINFPPQLLQEIKDQIQLPDLVQKYTRLNRHNKGLCPFHKERNPSFSVAAKKGLWHCFGCGKGGDVFAFIMEAGHLTFPSAVKLLAFDVGIRLPEADSIKKTLSDKWQEKKKKLEKINYLEDLFKDLENEIYSLKRFEIRCLPSKEKRDAKDYLKELLLEEDFGELEQLVEKRINLFEDMRRKVRNG